MKGQHFWDHDAWRLLARSLTWIIKRNPSLETKHRNMRIQHTACGHKLTQKNTPEDDYYTKTFIDEEILHVINN